jgi:hypothetical protein
MVMPSMLCIPHHVPECQLCQRGKKMTRYVVWRPDYDQTQADGRTIEAHSPAYACVYWAERDDHQSAEYSIARGNAAELMVAELGSSLPPFRYSVVGEAVPSYHATMLHGRPANV